MNSDKKKRLIIPVATLFVAVVMMAGVGYAAISSTFTVNNNSTVGGELEVSVGGITTATNKILDGAKIPYAVDTNDGTKMYKVPIVTNKTLVEKSVTITNNTGEDGNCNISGSITDGSLKAEVKNAISFKFYDTGGTEVTSVNVVDGTSVTLTMKVVLNVTSDIQITNPDTELNSIDITIKIVADKA